jgi:predicted LPLAT superfamily acyltransferase
VPRNLGQLLNKLETGTFKIGVAPTDLADAEHAIRSVANRVGAAVIVASLLIASALLARVHDLRWYAFGGFCAAFALGAYMLWKILRTPGEL